MNTLEEFLKDKSYIIFDFDRTIAKIEVDWDEWKHGVYDLISSFEVNFEPLETVDKTINKYIKKYGKDLRDRFCEFSRDFELENSQGFIENRGLTDFIKNNSTHTKYIFTSNSRDLVTKYLKEMGLYENFEKIVTRDDVFYIKPNPEGFDLIYDKRQGKEKYIMIGDRDADRAASESYGIDFLLVTEIF